jgi:hypothetical protein
VESVLDTTATITWTTDEEATGSVVFFVGQEKNVSPEELKPSRRHRIQLTGLAPGTKYRFAAKAQDGHENKSVSARSAFTTLAKGQVPEIMIDNAAATFVGSWSCGSSAPNKFGADYRYKSKGKGEASVLYRPDIVKSGEYDVFEWHSQGPNRASTTPVIIRHDGKKEWKTINQRVDGGQWLLLGRFYFSEGTDGFVRITDGFTDEGKYIVVADAVKFVYVGSREEANAKSGQ